MKEISNYLRPTQLVLSKLDKKFEQYLRLSVESSDERSILIFFTLIPYNLRGYLMRLMNT